MNNVIFTTSNNEYIVEIDKKIKNFSYTQFSRYDITINFKDFIGNNIFTIKCNEKQLFTFMNALFDITMEPGYIMSNICYFDNIFCYINVRDITDYPSEEDPIVSLQFFENSINGNISRLYIEYNLYDLEDLVMNIYCILEDIDSLTNMQYSSMLELMGEY